MNSLIDNLVITCDEVANISDPLKLILLIKAAYKMDYYIFHIFLLITMRLLLLIKHWLKQKDILPYS